MLKFSDFAPTTFRENMQSLIAVINRGECASAINYSRKGQMYRISQFLNSLAAFKKDFLNAELPRFICLLMDMFLSSTQDEIEAYINKQISEKNRKVVLFILQADLLLGDRPELLSFFNQLAISKEELSVIYFFKRNIMASFYSHKLAHYSSLYQNIIIKKPYTMADAELFITQIEKNFTLTLDDKVKRDILNKCGTKLWLIKEALRYIAKTKSQKNIFSHDEMLLRLQSMWSDLETCEQEVLKKIVNHHFDFNEQERLIVDYLQKIDLISSQEQKYKITIPLLKNYICTQFNTQNIIIDRGKNIIVNNVVVTHSFSKKEKALLIYLFNHANIVLNREVIAQTIWKEKYYTNYTDWSLDQLVRRLRLKLVKLGLQKSCIETKKNQGYMFKISK